MSRPRATYFIAYDIADPRRLRRVHRYMRKRALPVQYSVFIASLTRQGIEELITGVSRLIDELRDDIRCYTLPDSTEALTLGKQYLSAAIRSTALKSIQWHELPPVPRAKRRAAWLRRRRRRR